MIIVNGGLVSGVYASKPTPQVAVIDWDVFDVNGDEFDPKITRATHQGRPIQAHVAYHEVESLEFLRGSDAEAILLASQED